MNIVVISASTRINNNTLRVSKFLAEQLVTFHKQEVNLLDLGALRFPVMEEVIPKHPNLPDGLIEFQQAIVNADGALFVSPEYNGSFSPSLKNAVDYLKNKEFTRKPIGIVSISTGSLGGIRGALQMQQLVLGVGGYSFPQMLTVGNVTAKFDEAGLLLDTAYQKNVDGFLSEFLFLTEAIYNQQRK